MATVKSGASTLNQAFDEAGMSKKGFSLFELLIIIAVILILTAALTPVFLKMRETSKQSACISNLKRLSFGLLMYAQDHDGNFCAACSPNQTPPPGGYWIPLKYQFWQQTILPYTKTLEISNCPSMSTFTCTPMEGHYGVNGLVVVDPDDGKPLKQALVSIPSRTYLCFDSGAYVMTPARIRKPEGLFWYIPGQGDAGKPLQSVDPQLKNDMMRGRHNYGNNAVYCDGHAEWVRSVIMYKEALKPDSLPNAWIPSAK